MTTDMGTGTGAGTSTSTELNGRERGLAHLRRLCRRAVALEAAGWRSIGRAVFRRPTVPRGASAHRYDGPVRSVLVVFLVLSAVEIPVVDLVTHRWPAIRFPLLVLGIWSATAMLGMLCGYVTRPHAVGPDGIIVRNGGEVEVVLPWDDVASVAHRRRVLTGARPTSLTGPDDDRTLNLVVQDATDIDIQLEGPTTIRLPDGPATVTRVRVAVDDGAAFLDAVRRHIP